MVIKEKESDASRKKLVVCEDISFYYGSRPIFSNVSLSILKECHCVIVGANGCGKSTLLSLIQGSLRLPQKENIGKIFWFDEFGKADESPLTAKQYIKSVTPIDQMRYVLQPWALKGSDIILSGFGDGLMLYEAASDYFKEKVFELAKKIDATNLLDMAASSMSQGQLRLTLLMRALVSSPKLLLLDEAFENLDFNIKKQVESLVYSILSSTTICSVVHNVSNIFSFSKVLYYFNDSGFGQLDAPFDSKLKDINVPCVLPKNINKACPSHKTSKSCRDNKNCSDKEHISTNSKTADIDYVLNSKSYNLREEVIDIKNLRIIDDVYKDIKFSKVQSFADSNSFKVLDLKNIDVFIDRKQVLSDINWTVLPNENWLIAGANGSGKSTLLRLIYGQEFYAYGGFLSRFGVSNMSLQDIQGSIGYVSDSLHYNYGYNLTAEEVIISGLRKSIGLYSAVEESEIIAAKKWLSFFELEQYSSMPYYKLSTGLAKRCLLARAFAGEHNVLLLDEPCSGLDGNSQYIFFNVMKELSDSGKQFIYVSHNESNVPELFNNILVLSNGKVDFFGKRV